MSGAPMHDLAKLAATLARPDMKRRSVWHLLVARDHWGIILIRHAPKGTPPEKPAHGPSIRMSPEWLRRTGADLTPEQLIHERIGQHLRAHVQNEAEVDVARAASIAADAAIAVLAELGVNVADLRNPEETTAGTGEGR